MNNVDIKTPLVEFRDIHKRYGVGAAAFEALKGVNFRIDERRIRGDHGSFGLGKVHDDEHHRGARPSDGRGVPL